MTTYHSCLNQIDLLSEILSLILCFQVLKSFVVLDKMLEIVTALFSL